MKKILLTLPLLYLASCSQLPPVEAFIGIKKDNTTLSVGSKDGKPSVSLI